MKNTLITLLLISFFLPLNAVVTLPSILGDNMVLQQKSEVSLWGKAEKMKRVTIKTSWDNQTYQTQSSQEGDWKIEVKTPSAGGPYQITISDGTALTLSNVMIGEVWICSGQSNMEMPMKGFRGQPIDGATDAIASASSNNNIRLITLEINSSQTPLDDCKATVWSESTPQSVSNFSATAYYFGLYLQRILNVPVGLICTSWGGSKIQSWVKKDLFAEQFPEISLDVLSLNVENIKRPKDEPTLLYNAMIHPLINYSIKGAIWYQGESNIGESDLYRKMFPAMVQSWRADWGQGDFPFYYVQIAPYCYGKNNCENTDAADMRQVQMECLQTIPNSGMVVTSDIGHPTCIHPPQKPEVGKRLALQALANTYSREGTPCDGPYFQTMSVEGGEVRVEFTNSDVGMTSFDQPILGFEIAGSDNIFYPASAKLTDHTTKLSLSAKDVPNPVAVRHGYKNYQPTNLYNNFGLPVAPFSAGTK